MPATPSPPAAGLKTAPQGGIVIGQDFRTSVPGIWAIGDAAAFDGVRLGLLVASAFRGVGLRVPAAAGGLGRPSRRPPERPGARRRLRRRTRYGKMDT